MSIDADKYSTLKKIVVEPEERLERVGSVGARQHQVDQLGDGAASARISGRWCRRRRRPTRGRHGRDSRCAGLLEQIHELANDPNLPPDLRNTVLALVPATRSPAGDAQDGPQILVRLDHSITAGSSTRAEPSTRRPRLRG